MRFSSDLVADLRLAFRSTRRAPIAFSVAAGSLGVGVAAAVLVLGLAYALQARFRESANERGLVRLYATSPEGCQSCVDGFSLATFNAWASAGVRSIGRVSLFRESTVWERDSEQRTNVVYVDDSFFDVTAGVPVAGRVLQKDATSEAVASYTFWQSRLGGDRSILGKAIPVAGQTVVLVGVMPRQFRLPESTDVWVSNTADTSWSDLTVRDRSAYGRLAGSRGVEAARAEMATVAKRHAEVVDPSEAGRGAVVLAPSEWPERQVAGSGVWAVVVAVLGVFLLCMLNLSSMHHVRVLAREREFAVRRALGASSRRIVRQIVAEAMAVSIVGAVVGALVFRVGSAWAHEYIKGTFGIDASVVSGPVSVFSILLLSILAGLVTVLPTMLGLRAELSHELLRGSSQATRGQQRFRSALVVAQITGVFALVAASALMIQSFMTTYRTVSGFDDQSVDVVEVVMSNVDSLTDVRTQAAALLSAASSATDGSSVAIWSSSGIDPGNPRKVVLATSDGGDVYSAPGQSGWNRPYPATSYGISIGGLELLGIKLTDGRYFDASDQQGGEPVAILNEQAAAVLWPNQRVIGKQLKLGGMESTAPWLTIVGVVRNTVHPLRLGISQSLVTQGRLPSIMFRPFDQQPGNVAVLGIRPARDDNAVRARINSDIRQYAPRQTRFMSDVRRAREWMTADERIQRVRSATQILAGLTVAGLIISLLGVYGLVAESVQSRTREFAIRIALGSTTSRLVGLIANRLGILLSLAVLAGAIVSLVAARVGTTMMYGYQRDIRTGLVFGTTASNPVIYLAALCAVIVVVIVGAAAPVRRAVGVQPSEALKSEN